MVHSYELGFFFGAGASQPFGIPTMKKIVHDFTLALEHEGESKERQLYSEIVFSLEKEMGEVDIEAILSVIDGLKEYGVENVGEVAIFVSRNLLHHSLFDFDTQYYKAMPELMSLERRFHRFIRSACRLQSRHRSKVREVYYDFFNSISDAFGDGNSLSGGVRYFPGWTLFTTNYDRCLEAFWRDDARALLDTGFRDDNGSLSLRGTLRPDHFIYSHGSTLQFARQGASNLRLVKLHGSTTWLRRSDSGEVEEKEFDIDLGEESLGTGKMYSDEVVIYPLREKKLYVYPYIQMLYCLNEELKSKSIWIVVGYSFRDPVIRNIFLSNFTKDMKMIIIDPNPDVYIERLHRCSGKLCIVKGNFGDDKISEQMINTLKSL